MRMIKKYLSEIVLMLLILFAVLYFTQIIAINDITIFMVICVGVIYYGVILSKSTKKYPKAKLKKTIDFNVNLSIPNHAVTLERQPLDSRAISTLLKYKIDINKQDKDGQTALHKLLKANKILSAIVVIVHGARLDIVNNYSQMPLE